MQSIDADRLRVHVITSSGLVSGRAHLEVALAAIEGGADVVQLRAPELSDEELLPLAREIANACDAGRAAFVVNDRVDVAVAAGSAGVHVGQGDGPEAARDRLGSGRVLGISVATPEQALEAERWGADYVGVTVWPTPTKPEAAPLGLEGLHDIAEATRLPVVGIGGIDALRAPEVLDAGAAGIAVVSAVGGASDPVRATHELVVVVRRHLSVRG